MKCVIIDDDELSCKIISEFVNKSALLTLIGTYNDSIEARNILTKRDDIELIFLDVEMPEMDGFEFIGSLEHPPKIIIISSGEHYAAKAFDFNVIDYLIKPVAFSRFCKAIDKTVRYYSRKEPVSASGKEIFIKNGSALVKLKLNEIIYIEALENYVTLTTVGDKYTIHFTMKAIEEYLPPGVFIRVHRSYIINKSNIQTIKDGALDLIVGETLKSIPVGKSFRDALLNDINVMSR